MGMRRWKRLYWFSVLAFLLGACNPSGGGGGGGFGLTLNPSSLSLRQGDSGAVTVNLTRTNFTGPVTLSLVGSDVLSPSPAQDKVAWRFTPNPATGNQSVLTLQVGSSVPPGSYALVVQGEAQGLPGQVAALNLTVSAAPLGSISGTVIAPGTLSGSASPGPSAGPGTPGAGPDPTEDILPGEIIVKFKPTVNPLSVSQLQVNGVLLRAVRSLALERTRLYRAEGLDKEATLALAARLASRPDVEYAEPNRILRAQRIPNDPLYPLQWHYDLINLPAAWDITTGSPSVRVAVLDTGIVPHPDLMRNVVGGYDFVSYPELAEDGDGRDPDPTDVGPTNHGTHVAGTIGALTNNGLGVAGVAWGVRIVPVRVLGASGRGSTSDIIDAIVWAAGGRVPGVPDNTNPADVINMSLGGYGPCGLYQEAINFANSRGVVVVVAAGNENDDASLYRPANCDGVITVGAVGPTGERAPYSNYGPRIDVMAPGGDMSRMFFYNGQPFPAGVYSTAQDPASRRFTYEPKQGTSMATPHVAGVVALMKAQNPTLTYQQALLRLKNGAIFMSPVQCRRPSGRDCGSGLIDAARVLAGGGTTPPPPTPPPTRPLKTYVFAFFCTTPTCLDPSGNLAIDPGRSRYTVLDQLLQRTPYTIGGLQTGIYLVAAFQDLNGNEDFDENEPVGFHPNLVQVAGNEVTGIDIQLRYLAGGASSSSAEGALDPGRLGALFRQMKR